MSYLINTNGERSNSYEGYLSTTDYGDCSRTNDRRTTGMNYYNVWDRSYTNKYSVSEVNLK